MDTQTQQPRPQVQITPEIRSFLEGILKDAGMTELDEVMKEEMIKELFVRLDEFITSTIIDKLPVDNLDEFIKMGEEKKSMADTQAYLKEKIPNAEEVFARAFADFRETYLAGVTTARNAKAAIETNKIVDAQQNSIH